MAKVYELLGPGLNLNNWLSYCRDSTGWQSLCHSRSLILVSIESSYVTSF